MCGVHVIFITAPPFREADRKPYEAWLAENGVDTSEGLQYPILFAQTAITGRPDKREEKLSELGALVYTEDIGYTEAPLEMVYVLGKPDYSRGCERAKVRFLKWLRERIEGWNGSCPSMMDLKYMESGWDPICVGPITVHDTADRLPITREIEQFGPARLGFVDFRDPWVD